MYKYIFIALTSPRNLFIKSEEGPDIEVVRNYQYDEAGQKTGFFLGPSGLGFCSILVCLILPCIDDTREY